jgi:hypothetical protein
MVDSALNYIGRVQNPSCSFKVGAGFARVQDRPTWSCLTVTSSLRRALYEQSFDVLYAMASHWDLFGEEE